MDRAPAFLITAPIMGSGKTSLVTFASRAIHGRTVPARPLSAVNEEQRKTITSALLSNPPALLFDNLPAGSSFESSELAIAMTSGEWEDRKLGAAESVTLPNRTVWCFTGNNIALKADLKRRFVTIRMIPKSGAHHEQVFHRTLETWAIENRQEVLRALIAIALWGSRHAPSLKSESGFKEWDADVRRVVSGLTGHDPFIGFGEQQAGEDADDESEAEAAIVAAWVRFCGTERHTVAEFSERAHDAAKSSDPAKRRASEAVPSAVAVLRKKPLARLEPSDWGYVLRSLKDKPLVFGGVDLVFRVEGMRQKVAIWRLSGAETLAVKLELDF